MRTNRIWLVLLALPLFFFFQNCGKGFSSMEESGSVNQASLPSPTPDPTAPLSVFAFDSSVVQNNELIFEFRLNKDDISDIQINWQTENGTALAGTHFTGTTTSTTIPAGTTSISAKIPIIKSELTNIAFKVKVTSISKGDLAKAEAVLTITMNSVPVIAQLKNQWLSMSTSGAPSERGTHTAIWTGSKMIIWGGFGSVNGVSRPLNDGGAYDPVTNTWQQINLNSAPSAGRFGHTAVWSGSKMIIWGGAGDFNIQRNLNDGGIYDPVTNTWQSLALNGAPSGRNGHKSFWTGSKMIIWGGWSQSSLNFAETLLNTGGLYDPANNTWQPMSIIGAPSGRYTPSAVWTGIKMIVWGGSGTNGAVRFNDGGLYDPATNIWQSISMNGAPAARTGHTAVWTGSKMIIWGGNNSVGQNVNDGAIYDPATNTWQSISMSGAPTARTGHTAIWTGSRMIVFGGTERVNGALATSNSGGIYDVVTNTWQFLSLTGAPSARYNHSTSWTGSKMVVWGGYSQTGGPPQLNTGGVFE